MRKWEHPAGIISVQRAKPNRAAMSLCVHVARRAITNKGSFLFRNNGGMLRKGAVGYAVKRGKGQVRGQAVRTGGINES